MNELKECMNELMETHTGASIAGAIKEYADIVQGVAEDYTDDTTVTQLRAEHPELDFMDNAAIAEILKQAKSLRKN